MLLEGALEWLGYMDTWILAREGGLIVLFVGQSNSSKFELTFILFSETK